MGKQAERTSNLQSAKRKSEGFGCSFVMLGNGKFSLIDREDEQWVKEHLWHCHRPREYAVRFEGRSMLYLHRILMGLPQGRLPEVDHINGDGLDNRKCNLRLCSQEQNAANSRNIRQNKTSRYKGVRLAKGKWSARLKTKGKHIHLGAFMSERQAAMAYDDCARKTWGEFARTNFTV